MVLHSSSGQLHLVSVGPGFRDLIPPAAREALRGSDAVVGYDLYLHWIRPWLTSQRVYTYPITQEIERADCALALARQGQVVSLVSSGDIGIYGMGALVFERMAEEEPFDLNVVPGISAAHAAAALLGAPLSHDYATLSLSDRLCPWDWIEQRARKLAEADLVVALYNVRSRGRPEGVYRLLKMFLSHKGPSTVCGVARDAFREDGYHYTCHLKDLMSHTFDMRHTIVIGNRFTQEKGDFLYTPRGYQGWESPTAETSKEEASTPSIAATSKGEAVSDVEAGGPTIWVFTGTSDGNRLVQHLAKGHRNLVVSTASDYGEELASQSMPGITRVTGRMGVARRRECLRASHAVAIVDATHPFAERISKQLIGLADDLNIPYLRYERPSSRLTEAAHCVDTVEAAAARALDLGDRIFLATGSQQIDSFLDTPNAGSKTWFVRVAPVQEAMDHVTRAGVPRNHICAIHGPASAALNAALWQEWQIDCVVTKESGPNGGLDAKIEACRRLEIPLIVIRRPAIDYPWVSQHFEAIDEFLSQQRKQSKDAGEIRQI